MNRQVYLSHKESADRKANGNYKHSALAKMTEEARKMIMALKSAYYTSPAWYGLALANRPRNKHGKRVYHVTNF